MNTNMQLLLKTFDAKIVYNLISLHPSTAGIIEHINVGMLMAILVLH